jgi:hypothetical protein
MAVEISDTENAATTGRGAGRGVWIALYLLLALGTTLAFVLITHNVWEDFLITFRHSVNLVEGRGLVFNPQRPRRLQGFTSFLNVMLPAVFYLVTGKSEMGALNLYRGVCLASFIGGGYLLLRMFLRERGRERAGALAFILLYVTEAKTVAFTMNGQESALMVAFLAVGFYAAYRGLGKSWKISAAAWTGLLYTRPDAAVYIASLWAGGIIFRCEDVKTILRGIGKATAVSAVLFLPWFIFVWVYYGNPIPHTLLAKSSFRLENALDPVGTLWLAISAYPKIGSWIFLPSYCSFGGWPDGVKVYAYACLAISTFYWVIPSSDRMGRLASFCFVCGAFYMSFTSNFAVVAPWYLPATSVYGTVAIACALGRGMGRMAAVAAPVGAAIVAGSVLLLAAHIYQLRIYQSEIDDGTIVPMAKYLHDASSPGDRIYSEALGYIGYYSQRYMMEYPGLVTPEVVKLRREKRAGFLIPIVDLQPEWVVLRQAPMDTAMQMGAIRDHYTLARTFDAGPRLRKYGTIPGRGWLDLDSIFYVLRRNDVRAATEP